MLDDGVLGLAAIRARGGITIGQSPEDALFPSMPTNAREAGVLDRQAAAADIGAVLKELSHREIEELNNTCPDCNGSLVSIGEGHCRCRVGHAWTPDALLAARDDEVEGALWVALRRLQEKAKLARKLADRASPRATLSALQRRGRGNRTGVDRAQRPVVGLWS